MTRWLSTLVILALLALAALLPETPLGRRGREAQARLDVPEAFHDVGRPLPRLALQDLEGRALDLADFRGHPLIVTFERSVDW